MISATCFCVDRVREGVPDAPVTQPLDRLRVREQPSVDLESGLVTQLTDLPADVSGVTRCATEPVAYFWCGRRLASLDLNTLDVETLYERPEGYGGSATAATVDGERVVTAISERVDVDVERDGDDREPWMSARRAAGPYSEVISVPVDGGDPTVHVSEDRWLDHVNASPTRPELVTYCEEGPWEEVDRIWGLNLSTDESWQVRPTDADEAVGHEYWLADGAGERVAYHSHCQQQTLGVDAYTTAVLDLRVRRDHVGVECCGMAGSFGYKRDYYDVSVAAGEELAAQFTAADIADRTVVASGTSCLEQLDHLLDRPSTHPVRILAPE